MMASVAALRALWAPVGTRGVLLVVQLALYAAVGGGVYLMLAYRFGAVSAVIGNKALRRLMQRLPLGKKRSS